MDESAASPDFWIRCRRAREMRQRSGGLAKSVIRHLEQQRRVTHCSSARASTACWARLTRPTICNGCERKLERAKGIEPSYAAWEAAVLPLNYARLICEYNQCLNSSLSFVL